MGTNNKTSQVEKPLDLSSLVMADRKAREERAREAIAKILEKERCSMDVAMILRNGQVITQLSIVAIEQGNQS